MLIRNTTIRANGRLARLQGAARPAPRIASTIGIERVLFPAGCGSGDRSSSSVRSIHSTAAPSSPAGSGVVRTTSKPLFTKVMAANRGEIAIRILRASTELGIPSVSIFSFEDRYSPHRYKADESFLVGKGLSPVAAYLSIPEIIRIAKANGVGAIHPGYGLLSENADLSQACLDAGIIFVGPPPEVLRTFGDKTQARALAQRVGLATVPGTPGAVSNVEEARAFVREVGYPVIIKAAHGGGGRGMRVVRDDADLPESFARCQSEARAAFGNGDVFVEKYIENPRHIEVQVMGDRTGNVIHLFERDCSVQRRHQKVVEMAPARDLKPEVRAAMLADAVKLARAARYVNAGTVEFLLDTDTNKAYFIEVNPRIQVEHTVTEEVTGIDIVHTQLRIAAGMTLAEMGLTQDAISTSGYAVQCRITTEDPARGFQPDSGILSVYRSATGNGIRLDDGPGYAGAPITPHYDSLLVKVTARAHSFEGAVAKLTRALREHRIRGVSTNIGFLLNVLRHPAFLSKDGNSVTTRFIEKYPEVLQARLDAQNRGSKLLRFLSEIAVNGPDPALGATGPASNIAAPTLPKSPLPRTAGAPAPPRAYLRDIYLKEGPAAFAAAVRSHKGALLMDTTWRDAHQSLLATRLRTRDILTIAPATREALASAYALECWGGATFDVALRFLRECPWDRLAAMREAVPDIPFQMLIRGANAVGYTSYPDNAVFKFMDVARRHGMDVFRVFDSLNYLPNLQLGIEAAGAAGGVVEAAICYTGDVASGEAGLRGPEYKYRLEYYLELARKLVAAGTHVLAIKDMAGLLTPQSAAMLVGALRAEFPALPIHVHTHDTLGTGVASMVSAVQAGADVVDAATDAMSGSTSQPSMGALVASLAGTPHDTGLDLAQLCAVNNFWDECRQMYSPFESGQLTGDSEVVLHEMPGGQMTNLLYQSKQLGLSGQWSAIKRAYAAANRILGDIIKVTPSSKVVGDLAQFMVANRLSEAQVHEQASTLSFPQSVVEYLQGYLGIPHGGFPEPFRSAVLRGRKLPNGKDRFEGRPGAELPPLDLAGADKALAEKHGAELIREVDVMSSIMYPAVFDEFVRFNNTFGDISVLPTRYVVTPMRPGEEISFEIQRGKTLFIKLKGVGVPDDTGHREVTWEMNGEARTVRVPDKKAGAKVKVRARAEAANPSHVGAPMPGAVVDVRVKPGAIVTKGQPLCVLSAMKMETVVAAPRAGKVSSIAVIIGDTVDAGDLVACVEA